MLKFQFFVLFALVSSLRAQSKTLAEFIKSEDAIEFGECKLSPQPKTSAPKTLIVVPSWFEKEGYWVTHSVLLIGVDDKDNIQDQIELRVKEELSPKEIVKIECIGDQIKIENSSQSKPKKLIYKWNGTSLTRKK